MVSAVDVADRILEMRGTLATSSLHNLLYFCQGWHLAFCGEKLFDDDIHGWAGGPVVESVHELHIGMFRLEHPLPSEWDGDGSRLSDKEDHTVDYAVNHFYLGWTAGELSAVASDSLPWIEARHGLRTGDRGNRALKGDTMELYFSRIASLEEDTDSTDSGSVSLGGGE